MRRRRAGREPTPQRLDGRPARRPPRRQGHRRRARRADGACHPRRPPARRATRRAGRCVVRPPRSRPDAVVGPRGDRGLCPRRAVPGQRHRRRPAAPEEGQARRSPSRRGVVLVPDLGRRPQAQPVGPHARSRCSGWRATTCRPRPRCSPSVTWPATKRRSRRFARAQSNSGTTDRCAGWPDCAMPPRSDGTASARSARCSNPT